MIRVDQINFRKDGSTVQGGCEILNVWDWISVRDSSIVQCTIIPAGAPITKDLFGTMCSGEDQLLDEGRTMPSCNMCSNSCRAIFEAFWSQSLGTRADWWAGGLDVMCHIVLMWLFAATRLRNCRKFRQNGLKLCQGSPRE